jgi:hypothetical protein
VKTPAMKTNNNTTSTNNCLPCDIPPLCRNNYFTGKLLTERDFTAEQKYMADKLRLHHVALHGWGIVCGLKVIPHPNCPALRIVVEPGLAIDGCGREVRVPQRVELTLPAPTALVTEDPCPPDPASDEIEQEMNGPGEGQTPDQPTITVYVGLRYLERGAELMPAPFNECACGSSGNQPNRVCESYELQIFTDEPDCFELVRKEKEECDSQDPEAIYKSLLDGCPEPRNVDWIPLAVIRDFIPGQEVRKESIHNRIYRRRLPSTTALDRLIGCILEKIPTRTLTRIIEINWTHRFEYHTHDFMRQFIGEHESSPGFEVTFDRPVRKAGITQRIFQAIAIRYVENTHGAGQPEVAPATVRLNAARTKVHLHIDPLYARNRLEKTRFELYLLLRCNLIVDDRGSPVDGELLAGLDSDGEYATIFPTGDGLPGGLFESWIRVVHHTDHH